jgi:oxalate---CoA ligase
MVFGAPNEGYDPESASRLLHSIGEEPTSAATSNLLSRGVLSKSIRDPKQTKPGRTLKISEVYVFVNVSLRHVDL